MKGKHQDTNRDSKIERIFDRITKKLGESHKINRNNTRSNKEIV